MASDMAFSGVESETATIREAREARRIDDNIHGVSYWHPPLGRQV
jgi:hypothetical protein